MSKSKKGGLPRDTLFRSTEVQEEAPLLPSVEGLPPLLNGESVVVEEESPQQVNISQSKQVDIETSHDVDADAGEKQKTTDAPRQTYYIPAEMHKQLRLLALEQGKNVSDLVVEGIEWVLGKYEK